jgi:hypothetical protein
LRDDAVPGLEVSVLMPLTRLIGQPQLCKQCNREVTEPDPAEDDASTSNEVAEE